MLKKILFLIFALAVIGLTARIYYQAKHPSSIRAFGDLTVDFGSPFIPPDGPIFTFDDFKPGDCTQRTITITNDGGREYQVSVIGLKTDGYDRNGFFLENILNLIINNGTTDYYNGTVGEFFTNSGGEDGLLLDKIPAGGSKSYTFQVCFPWEAGNEYQTLSVKFDLKFGTISYGCTYTIGYWKTHSGIGSGNQKDMITPLLPISLGTTGGAKSLNVTSVAMAVDVLGMKKYGTSANGITKLYAQLLAAKLNINNGAKNTAVASVISDADAFLANHDYNDWKNLSKSEQKQVNGWMTILDNFNNGLSGPGHCE